MCGSQTHSLEPARLSGAELSRAVIDDIERRHMTGARPDQANDDVFGVSVFDDVGDGLLDDTQYGDGLVCCEFERPWEICNLPAYRQPTAADTRIKMTKISEQSLKRGGFGRYGAMDQSYLMNERLDLINQRLILSGVLGVKRKRHETTSDSIVKITEQLFASQRRLLQLTFDIALMRGTVGECCDRDGQDGRKGLGL